MSIYLFSFFPFLWSLLWPQSLIITFTLLYLNNPSICLEGKTPIYPSTCQNLTSIPITVHLVIIQECFQEVGPSHAQPSLYRRHWQGAEDSGAKSHGTSSLCPECCLLRPHSSGVLASPLCPSWASFPLCLVNVGVPQGLVDNPHSSHLYVCTGDHIDSSDSGAHVTWVLSLSADQNPLHIPDLCIQTPA